MCLTTRGRLGTETSREDYSDASVPQKKQGIGLLKRLGSRLKDQGLDGVDIKEW